MAMCVADDFSVSSDLKCLEQLNEDVKAIPNAPTSCQREEQNWHLQQKVVAEAQRCT